ncbi:MAG TPA: hypothetical protein VND65_15240 [Candidatus Binatia bacterium]|nr:hypothetical protein [Candidatus Binatia bacterium]
MSSALVQKIKRFLVRLFAITAGVAVGGTAILYAGDLAIFRYRVSGNHQPYGQVTVTHYYAVLQKDGKTEFIFDPPQAQTCANTLFPQGGYTPCWWLQRHPEQRTNV